MLKTILFKVTFASAKAGVKESAEYFAASLQGVRRDIKKPGRSFEMCLLDHDMEPSQFYNQWVSAAIQTYIERYPPKTPLQQQFLTEVILPKSQTLCPSMISDVIIKYGYSEFHGLCQTLASQGDDRGWGALLVLGNIVEDAFRSRGLEDALEY